MTGQKVVVVESPAKAKTINKYLGEDFYVLASYGHVRDLPPKDGSVQPDEDFSMKWEVDARAKKRIDDIVKACKGATSLFLATDPDREGEAISWHIQEELKQRKGFDGLPMRRVVFNEITKSAVTTAMANPRDLNQELVKAYLARRALDYLVGFTLSPVLWRKLPGAKSAGRVQSVALRLICEREAEIEAFKAREYWSVEALMATPDGVPFTARLTHLMGKKLDKFDLGNETAANSALTAVKSGGHSVSAIERKQVKRHPAPPFTTSTLQQEAIKAHDGPIGAQGRGFVLGDNINGDLIQGRAFHLAGNGALPDQLVQPQLILIQIARDLFRAAAHIGGADTFVGFLGILCLAAILTRAGWQIVIAIDIADHAARRADGFARHNRAVGAHIGDQTNSLTAQGDPFI